MNAETKPEASADSNTVIRVLKIATCPSLSGKSTLTYHIGYAGDGEDSDDIQFRVVANTNIGFFSQKWVPFSVIRGEFDKIPAGQTITSFLLHGLFRGKSVNTPAFLFAVLKAEGLVQAAKDKQRRYERVDPAGFIAMVRALIASKVELQWDQPVKAAAKSAKAADKSPKSDAVAAKPTTKAAKVPAKTVKADAKPTAVVPKVDASATKPATGVDIAEIVEVINAKVPAEIKPAAPAKKANAKPAPKTDAKTTAKTDAKPTAQAEQ